MATLITVPEGKVCAGKVCTITAKGKDMRILAVAFADKPDNKTRQTLKDHGMRFYPKQGTWSCKYDGNDDKLDWLKKFVSSQNQQTKIGKVVRDSSTTKTEQVQVKPVFKNNGFTSVSVSALALNEPESRDGITVGDIFYSVHGYNMTYYFFYQVIGFCGKKSVKFREIGKSVVTGDSMVGEVIPVKDNFITKETFSKVVESGGENPRFRSKERLYRHQYGHKYWENHLD